MASASAGRTPATTLAREGVRCRFPAPSAPIRHPGRRAASRRCLSGGGVAAGSLGLPDLGISNLDDVLTDVRRITDACPLPLLVDADTGFGASAFNIARTVQLAGQGRRSATACTSRTRSGTSAAATGRARARVSRPQMVDRVKAAADAQHRSAFVIMARTDALAVEGLDAAIDRAPFPTSPPAPDMIFPGSNHGACDVPALRRRSEDADPRQHHVSARPDAPFHPRRSCASAGVADRALSAVGVSRDEQGRPQRISHAAPRRHPERRSVDTMQTRAELYDFLRAITHSSRSSTALFARANNGH